MPSEEIIVRAAQAADDCAWDLPERPNQIWFARATNVIAIAIEDGIRAAETARQKEMRERDGKHPPE